MINNATCKDWAVSLSCCCHQGPSGNLRVGRKVRRSPCAFFHPVKEFSLQFQVSLIIVLYHCLSEDATLRPRPLQWLLRLRVLSLMSWCSLGIMTIKLFGVSLDSFIWLLFSAGRENYFIKKHSPTGKLTLNRLEYIWNSQVNSQETSSLL